MSRTLDALRAAQKGIILNSPEKEIEANTVGYVADNNSSKAKFGLVATIVLLLIFAIVLAVNIKLFIAFRNSGAKFEETLKKMNSIEQAFSTGIAKLDSKITSINSKLEKNSDLILSLDEKNRAQKNLISDLNKTNDALTRRLSAVETQLGQLKNLSVAK